MAVKTKHASSMAGGLLYGGILSLVCTLVGAGIAAKLTDVGTIKEDAIGYCVMTILLASSFLGTNVACGRIRRRPALVSLLSAIVYYLTLIGITALFFGGQYTAMGVTLLLVLAGSGTALLLKTGKGRGKPKGSYPKAVRKIVQSDYR